MDLVSRFLPDTVASGSQLDIAARKVSIPRVRRARGARQTFTPSQLHILGDVLVERVTGLLLAKLPPGLTLRDIERLTVTSSSIDVVREQLVTCCSGPCARQLPLASMGLRNVGGGSLRNQPQCPECRGRYRKRSK